jgi:hypothetical protein
VVLAAPAGALRPRRCDVEDLLQLSRPTTLSSPASVQVQRDDDNFDNTCYEYCEFSMMEAEDTSYAASYDIANEGRMTMLSMLASNLLYVGTSRSCISC